jgi:hypothetical protein
MTTTISNIGQEINQIISSSKSIPSKLTEEEKINRFLDGINNLRTKLVERTEKIKKLDGLFSKLTWYDLKNQEEEDLMKSVISKSISFHSKSIKNFVSLKRNFWKDKICRDEITNYKDTLDDFEESIYEVKEIFFNLRKDSEFNDLMNSL